MNDADKAARPDIPGYDFGIPGSATSPLSEEDLRLLEQTVGWSEEDSRVLRKQADLFRQQAQHMVDSWRSVIGAHPHLSHWFVGPNGEPDDDYKARVKHRFVQWVIDVTLRDHDRDWLNYQEEIGLRHTPAKKNQADGKQTPSLIPLRYLLGFVPVVLPIGDFFADLVQDKQEMKNLQNAWTKAVLLHVTLWSRPYTAQGLW